MLFAVFFAFWRFCQIFTLIPTMGMLAWFVKGWNSINALTPIYVLVLFIVSVIALAWCLYTIFSYHRSSTSALWTGIIDLLFMGAFIGAVYTLRFVGTTDCSSVSQGSAIDVSFGPFGSASVNTWDVSINKTCAMLKACFAFGIMNCIFFFFTAVLAWFHGEHTSKDDRVSYVRETHYHRHGHRSGGSRSHRSSHHSRSPHSRHSSHSHSRYHV